MLQGWNQEQLKEFGLMEGFKWDFAPADAPWQNGVSEALVKSVKRAITAAISDHVMTFSELQTVCFDQTFYLKLCWTYQMLDFLDV